MNRINRVLATIVIFTFLFLSHFGNLSGVEEAPTYMLTVKECLLPKHHPLQDQLKPLFQDKNMFDSRDLVKEAGFHHIKSQRKGIMVVTHPNIEGYLIKKFQSSVAQKEQLENYIKRISGARALQEFIKSNHLQHIVVPQKWLYRLPKSFSDKETGERTYVLIVEKMDLCSKSHNCDGNTKKYQDIDEEILREICIVVYNFRGLDSVRENMPFTTQNQVAFIDTEKWEENRPHYLGKLRHHLSEKSIQFAEKVFQELEAQDALRNFGVR